MSNKETINDFFESQKIPLIGPAVKDPESGEHLVFIKTAITKSGTQKPNNYAISQAEKIAESKFGQLQIVLVNHENEDINASIKSLLIRKYPDDIRNVFSQVTKKEASVWVEPKAVTSLEKSQEFSQAVSNLLKQFGINLVNFVNTNELNLPSETICLNILRRKAPVSLTALIAELRNKNFDVPNEDWISRILDKWRKKKLLIRKSDGDYVMTIAGLEALGSGTDRHSPDIKRALELTQYKL